MVQVRFFSRTWLTTLKLPGSPYREELNKGILMMQESGRMEMLVKKWIGLEGSECAAEQAGLIGWLAGMLQSQIIALYSLEKETSRTKQSVAEMDKPFCSIFYHANKTMGSGLLVAFIQSLQQNWPVFKGDISKKTLAEQPLNYYCTITMYWLNKIASLLDGSPAYRQLIDFWSK